MSPLPGAEINVQELYHVPRSQVWEGSRGRARGNIHLHVREDVTLGRIKRRAGECLCPKKHGSYERPADADDQRTALRCEKCATVATRFGIPWPSSQQPTERAFAYRKLAGVNARLMGTFMPTSTEVYEAGTEGQLECAVCQERILPGDRFTRGLSSGHGRGRVHQCRVCRPFQVVS